jgi:hypothetical protein
VVHHLAGGALHRADPRRRPSSGGRAHPPRVPRTTAHRSFTHGALRAAHGGRRIGVRRAPRLARPRRRSAPQRRSHPARPRVLQRRSGRPYRRRPLAAPRSRHPCSRHRTLGAGPAGSAFRDVTLPRLRPALAAAQRSCSCSPSHRSGSCSSSVGLGRARIEVEIHRATAQLLDLRTATAPVGHPARSRCSRRSRFYGRAQSAGSLSALRRVWPPSATSVRRPTLNARSPVRLSAVLAVVHGVCRSSALVAALAARRGRSTGSITIRALST